MAQDDAAEQAAHVERTHQMAFLYKLYLDDAFAVEDYEKVAHWAEHLYKCLRSRHAPDGPVSIPAPVQRRPAPSQRIISLE